jgi:hypothetical protein
MGLFGYNEKDYQKNTANFKSRLENLMNNTYDRGVSNFGVGKTIAALMVKLDTLPYPKGGKELAQVDAEIDKIISAMEQDAMKKRMSSVLMRAESLSNELDASRRFGKNAFTADERQAEATRADALGHIHDALNRQEIVDAKKKELIEKAAKASEAQQQKYRLEYNALDREGKMLAQTVTMWTSRYNTALEVINARGTAGQIGELEAAQVCDLKAFEKEMADASRRLEKQIMLDTDTTNVATEATSGFDQILGGASNASNGFDAAVEDQRQKNLMDSMGGSAPGFGSASSGSQADDPFTQAMRNQNN